MDHRVVGIMAIVICSRRAKREELQTACLRKEANSLLVPTKPQTKMQGDEKNVCQDF